MTSWDRVRTRSSSIINLDEWPLQTPFFQETIAFGLKTATLGSTPDDHNSSQIQIRCVIMLDSTFAS